MYAKEIQEIRPFQAGLGQKLPLYLSPVAAGFPSPAEDYLEKALDLNEHLVPHPAATFFVRVKGDSMIQAGIHDQDILIVDRSLEAKHNQIVIAAVDGDLTVKRLLLEGGKILLAAENPNYPTREIQGEDCLQIWGVTTYVIHSLSS